MKCVTCVVVLGALLVIPTSNVSSLSFVARAEASSHESKARRDAFADQALSTPIEIVQATADEAPSDMWEEYEEEEEVVDIADPIYYWNKGMYHFNDKFYFWVLKPVARGYRWAVPEEVREGVKNFFHNLSFPIRFVSCLLQAKGSRAAGEFGRFFMNTTWGILGFGNPAKDCPRLNPPEEDLGQTFGAWGMGNGFYIVWPFLGPSTARDSVGLVGETYLDPVRYVEPMAASLAITTWDTINETSFRIGDYEALKDAAIDPYTSIRDAYVQHRKKQVEE
ncbi:MAG: VacJ family lipoprotein [Thermodesulfobacteriota bacterium]|nr:VacJ family lipoprotein [Thermodesulfobacteriota bacterium]